MTRLVARLTLAILPLALGLAGCGKSASTGSADAPAADVLPKVPAPQGKAWSDLVVAKADGGYVMGNPDAPIKLVEYGSLTCPHCAEFARTGFAHLRDDYVASGRVSFEYRNYVRDPFDTTLALLTHCGTPDAFFGLTEEVYANQKDLFAKLQPVAKSLEGNQVPPKDLFRKLGTEGGLVDFFAARGVSRDAALACLGKADVAKKLADDVQASSDKYNITGTPTFIVNGKNVEVATWEALEPVLQRAGAR